MRHEIIQGFAADFERGVPEHFFDLHADPLVARVREQAQGAIAHGGGAVFEQAAQRGMPARLSAQLEQAQAVQDFLLAAALEGLRQHFHGRRIQHPAHRHAFRVKRPRFDGLLQHVQVFLPHAVGHGQPSAQEGKIHQAHLRRRKLQAGRKSPQHQAGNAVRRAPDKAVNERLDLVFDLRG